MEDLTKYTPTELLKMVNDTKSSHDELKTEILRQLEELDDIERKINENIAKLNEHEKYYVDLIDELNKR
jgi:hypothetical protein